MVSLGCPKNRVDSEVMLGTAVHDGFEIVADPGRARVIVINTCGFIEAAKRESIDTIFELARFKAEGSCERLVVTGCLAQRYAKELAAQIPEIDHILGSGNLGDIATALNGTAPRVVLTSPGYLTHASDHRVLSTGAASAFVKIAEGCDRGCAFCIIPQIRGKHRSRPVEDIVSEVRDLAEQGILEVNLVSQDTIAYGRDLSADHKPQLASLVQQVADVPGIHWVRLLYFYPDALDDALIDLIAGHPRVLPYIDMPMQHAADAVLKRMRRGHTRARLEHTIDRLRTRIPGLTLRTAFIVGFPGETDEDFEQLCDFVRQARFDRLGVFRYSDEEDTAAYDLDDKLPARVSYNRARKLMAIQRRISRQANRNMVGQQVEVLVEQQSSETELLTTGRHAGQAPGIDGQVLFTESDVLVGEMRRARVVQADDYDLIVEALDEPPLASARAKATRRLRQLPVV